ncbi:MAG: hypothetical protein JRI44_13825 [Deltaproteobacteria bacterium]|nr:hypothetical protein [Deltaproteobacteria bacterium]
MKVKIFKSLIIISLAAIFILPQMVFAVDNAELLYLIIMPILRLVLLMDLM